MTTLPHITATSHHIDEDWDMKPHVLTTQNMEKHRDPKTTLITSLLSWWGTAVR
jgi:hypothetical protein